MTEENKRKITMLYKRVPEAKNITVLQEFSDDTQKIVYFDNWRSKIVLAKCITSARLAQE